jgi:hypothetical protein
MLVSQTSQYFSICRRVDTHFLSCVLLVEMVCELLGSSPLMDHHKLRYGLTRSLPSLSAKAEKGAYLMKVDMSFLEAFLLIRTDLLGRATVQGVEPALASTAIEYGSAGLNLLSRWVRVSRKNLSLRRKDA